MNNVDIPFKLIISLIVIESMFFQAKNQEGKMKPKQQTRWSETFS